MGVPALQQVPLILPWLEGVGMPHYRALCGLHWHHWWEGKGDANSLVTTRSCEESGLRTRLPLNTSVGRGRDVLLTLGGSESSGSPHISTEKRALRNGLGCHRSLRNEEFVTPEMENVWLEVIWKVRAKSGLSTHAPGSKIIGL